VRGHVPAAVSGLQPLRHLEGTNRLRLAIGLPFRDAAGASDLLRQLYDPASTNYHRFLTLEQFRQRFGASDSDYQAVQAYATVSHLALQATYPNRLVVDLEGSVDDIEKALNLTIQVYQHPTEAREFFAPSTEPSLDLAIPVLHIGGLDNFIRPRPLLVKRSLGAGGPSPSPALGSGPGGTYMGNDFRAAYLPGVSLTGVGQTVGLLEFDSGFYQSDITSYETMAGLTNIPVNAVLLDSYGGGPGNGNDEVSLDIEMAAAMAPGLQGINVYEGDAIDDILSQMASDTYVSQFGASWTYGIDAESDQLFQEMAMQGQSFFNASGDSDADVGGVPSPTDDTNITAVGGTTLSTEAAGGNWTSEKVWNWGGGEGSSGGISTANGIPPWQTGINMAANHGSTVFRNVPDVALTADNIFVVYGNGSQGSFGGTSCATPLWAAFVSLVNQQAVAHGGATQGFINPAIYALGKSANYTRCFHDIAAGNNTWSSSPNLFYAVPGYDLCTGWGSPAGQALIDALAPDALVLAPEPALFAVGFVGGPFNPPSINVVLTNTSGSLLQWTCGSAVSWLAASPTGGNLGAGQTQSVQISLTPSANTLAPGVYAGDIIFTNESDGAVQSLANTLVVNPPADLGAYASTLLFYGPVAYWQLNETNPVPPADVLSNAGSLGVVGTGFPYDGVVQGQPGVVSNCAAFSNPDLNVAYLGTHINVTYNTGLNSAGPFTVEFWANPNQSPTDFFCPISSIDDIENNGTARYGWVFYMASGNQWVFRIGNVNGYVAAVTGGTVQAGTWQHIAGVYNGSTATLYVNGVAVAGPTAASGYHPNTNITVPLRLGATSFGNRTFDGSVDEVAVFSNALSASVISAHYQAATTNNAGYGAQILASHPVGYWHLDEPAYSVPGSLPTAFNLGSLSYLADGVFQPGSTPGVAGVPGAGFGVSNRACAFQDTAYIDVPGGAFSLTGPLTVSAWVQAPPPSGLSEAIVSLGSGSVQLGIDAQGRAQFVDGVQSFGFLHATNSIADNQWHNVVGIYDGGQSEYLYVDGKLAAQSSAATTAPLSNGNDLFIGNDPDPGYFEYFEGVIDEVAVFTNALSAHQVLWLFANGANATQLSVAAGGPFSRTVNLTCSAVAGETYSLQSCTNLNQPNWITVSGPVAATSSTLNFRNIPALAQQGFYRLVLVP